MSDMLYVTYISDQEKSIPVCGIDTADTLQLLHGGQPLYTLIDGPAYDEIGDFTRVGYLSFSGQSRRIFPESIRILERSLLEKKLTHARWMRNVNRWLPFIELSIPSMERLCDAEYGRFSEDFIKRNVLTNAQADRFYVNIPYWTAYIPIGEEDMVLPLHQLAPAGHEMQPDNT